MGLPKDDGCSLLVLSNVSAQFLSLFEGKPEGGFKVHRMQQENIDATISLFADKISGPAGLNCPRLVPGDCSLFEERNHALGDDVVNSGFHNALRFKIATSEFGEMWKVLGG